MLVNGNETLCTRYGSRYPMLVIRFPIGIAIYIQDESMDTKKGVKQSGQSHSTKEKNPVSRWWNPHNKINCSLYYIRSTPKIHLNPLFRISVLLLTDRQTDKQTLIKHGGWKSAYDCVMGWKRFPHYWPLVHRRPVIGSFDVSFDVSTTTIKHST